MTDISEARQALRDYAREEIVERRTLTGNFDHVPYKFVVGTRGTTAGKAFVAAQAALTVVEELREEGGAPLSSTDPYGNVEERASKRVQREVANRIELAILKALKS
jgi:hypothetical protein